MLKVWWSQGPKPGNFGDILTPYILNYYNISFEFSKKDYNTICIGSIASKAKDNTLVLGSGIIDLSEKLNVNAKWKFVRGPETRNAIIKAGGACPKIYGDPALLLPLFHDAKKKQHDLGIIPHYVDYDLVKDTYKNEFVIDVLNNPLTVADQITTCRYIISSSLHGIIVANAYGIPAAWVKFSDKLHGDNIKFKDYGLSLDLNMQSSSYKDPNFLLPNNINITNIDNIFKELSNL